jgi:metal-sulfur cluster biosynthetic enzyme
MVDLENNIVSMLKTIYDPEIPVDIYELGLIYEVKISKENEIPERILNMKSWDHRNCERTLSSHV